MNQRDDCSYELISAFLDGEVSPDERARVEQLVASSAEHRQVLEDLRAVTHGMQQLPDYYLDGDFSQRVSTIALQSSGRGHEIDVASSVRFSPTAAVWYRPALLGLAATAAAVALIVFILGNRGTDSTGSAGSPRVAQAPDAPADSTRDELPASVNAPLITAPSRDGVVPSAMAPLIDHPPSSSDARSTADTVVHTDLPPSGESTISSDSAPTGKAAVPASTMVASERVTSRSLPDQTRVGDRAAADDGERLPELLLNDVPFSGTQQLLLVIDVALTRQGSERDAFERALADKQIPLENTVPFDAKLEESLLASRFFEPLKTPPDGVQAAHTDMSLVYVGAQAGHVEAICNEMQSNAEEFAAIAFDVAFLPNDQALFQKLQQAVQQQAAHVPPVVDAQLRERRAAAYRLALSPSWRGTLSPKLKGVEGLPGPVPGWMLGGDAANKPLIDEIPGQPLPQVPLPPGGRLGENIDVEALFVVHVGRGTQE